jgi:flagellar hook-basal body complex protein FliE
MASIQGASAAFPPLPPTPAPSGGSAAKGGFGETLGRLLEDVNASQRAAAAAATALSAGRPVDTAQTLVAIEKANITFQFAMQVRNKLLEAYQEIMRMPV